jgi:hypothetical protein
MRRDIEIKCFLIAVCALATFATYGKNPDIVGKWALDSVRVVEIVEDGTEKTVNYNDVKRSINCVFDTIVIGTNNKCRLIAGKNKTSVTAAFTDDNFIITTREKENLIYQYRLDGILYLKRRFFTSGAMIKEYIIEMVFTKK